MIFPEENDINEFFYSEIIGNIRDEMDSDDVVEIKTAISRFVNKYILLNQSTLCTLSDQNKTERTCENVQCQ
jgi:hypothetical protein